ncbi:hypothetical protein WMY93_002012 [Mugilogobius chulae]|uniref:Membrane protein, palmitoylated 4a (MAGUK p55 subfamily member 4) n=1 Tax=Mugilogobius chulae TaxID=88201 RepID=A0AAW0PYE2_9GOBI
MAVGNDSSSRQEQPIQERRWRGVQIVNREHQRSRLTRHWTAMYIVCLHILTTISKRPMDDPSCPRAPLVEFFLERAGVEPGSPARRSSDKNKVNTPLGPVCLWVLILEGVSLSPNNHASPTGTSCGFTCFILRVSDDVMKQTMEEAPSVSQITGFQMASPPHVLLQGVSEVLSSVVQDVGLVVSGSSSGAQLLQELLSAPWLSALLKMYESLLQFQRLKPSPLLPCSAGVSHEILYVVSKVQRPSAEARELFRLLCSPHMKALLWSHDTVAQQDFGPVLEPLPEDLPDDEEAVRIVCLVKNNQPLGATIKRDEKTGQIYIARVIHGGLADRSGLLNAGDLLLEVNGNPVSGLEPEQVIKILVNSQGTILFKVVPNSSQTCSSQKPVYMRAMVDYCPLEDSSIPLPAAGVSFCRADVLEVVDQSDGQWWQARRLPTSGSCAGLIPSASNLKSKQREQWWCQPLQTHTCIKPRESCFSLLHLDLNTSSSHTFYLFFLLLTVTLGDSENGQAQIDDPNLAVELEDLTMDEADAEQMDKLYIAGFRKSFRFWRRSSLRRRRQSCSSCCPGNSSLATPYEEVTLFQRPLQDTHRLIVLVGASGVGVNELRKRLIRINPHDSSDESRRADRATYHFVNRELFDHMISNHRFVEHGEHRGHLYGTSFDAIEEVLQQGRICVIDVEPRSIQSLRIKTLKPFVIFVKVPNSDKLRETRRDAQILTKHGHNRTFMEEDFVELEETSKLIEAKYKQFFDCVLVNENLHESCLQLCSIVQRAQDQEHWVPVSWTREDL